MTELQNYKLQELLKEVSKRVSYNGEVQKDIEVGVGCIILTFKLDKDFEGKGDPK